jgi:hypothetical protein
MRKIDRQIALKNQYCFVCDCEACSQRTLQNFSVNIFSYDFTYLKQFSSISFTLLIKFYFKDKFQKLNCEVCGGPIEIINNLSMYCVDCETTFDLVKNKLYELEEANKLYESAKLYIQSEHNEEALETAKKCLEIRKNILNKHHEVVAFTYDLIGKILAIMGKIFIFKQFYKN